MKILAIETSCDDTGIAILEASGFKKPFFKVLSNIVSSQVEIHKKYGGVFPMLAKREHQRNLLPVLTRALKESKLLKISKSKFLWTPAGGLPEGLLSNQILNPKLQTLKKILGRENNLFRQLEVFLKKYREPKIDAITVTIGPGLEPCLWVGVNFAKALAYYWKLPIIAVNHIESHILVNFLKKEFQVSSFKFQELFPAICLVVSGGHTQLILMRDFGKYKILGETRDDAAGECFDKTARILGLGYPGGPAIAAEAAKFLIFLDAKQTPRRVDFQFSIKLPRPMINAKNYDFSFSGLKTAVLYQNQKLKRNKFLASKSKNQKYKQEMAREIQQAIIDVLMKKTIKAVKDYNAKTIILGGGVTANEELRKQFNSKLKTINSKLNFLVPAKNLCTDNALMVAVAGYFRYKNRKIENWKKIKVDANLKIR